MKIPVARPSSITSAEPTWCPPISVAASATVAVGSTATRSLLMMSRTVVMPSSKPSRRRPGREALRGWYAPRRGAWRGSYRPYAVWVSEVMLQQTQAGRVVPAFRSFLRRFPTLRARGRAAPGRRTRSGAVSATTVARSGSRRPPRPRRPDPARPGDAARLPGGRSVHRCGGRLARVRSTDRGRRHQRPARRQGSGEPGGRRSRRAGERGVGARRRVARSRTISTTGGDGSRTGGVPAEPSVRRPL